MDHGYLEWLERAPIGRQYVQEVDALLRRVGRRVGAPATRIGLGLSRRP